MRLAWQRRQGLRSRTAVWGPRGHSRVEATTDERKEPKDVEHSGGGGREFRLGHNGGEEAAGIKRDRAADDFEDDVLKRIRRIPRMQALPCSNWFEGPPARGRWMRQGGPWRVTRFSSNAPASVLVVALASVQWARESCCRLGLRPIPPR